MIETPRMFETPRFTRVGAQVRPSNRAGVVLLVAVVLADIALVLLGVIAMLVTGSWVWLVVTAFTGSMLLAVFFAWLWMKAAPKPVQPEPIVSR